jgi:hypothetical protein
MLQAIEVVIHQHGRLRIPKSVKLPRRRRVIITILDEEPSEASDDVALLSEAALARDWERPEEDEAWLHLRELPSL